MRVLVRDVNDPFDIRPAGVRGGIDIIDLANRYSCAFIETQDIARVFDDGSFEIEGIKDGKIMTPSEVWNIADVYMWGGNYFTEDDSVYRMKLL